MDASRIAPRAAEEMVREANHRIANQLSLLTGMIQLQIDSLARGPESLPRAQVREVLRNVCARVVAIGNLNRQLARSSGGAIDLCPFLASTRHELVTSLSADERVQFVESFVDGCHVTGEQATVLCLVMSEIIINALKYARPQGGVVSLSLDCCRRDDGGIVVALADDGVGLPPGFDETQHGRVGFKLIRNLVRQIGAELTLKNDGRGLGFHITLPRPKDGG